MDIYRLLAIVAVWGVILLLKLIRHHLSKEG